jgi:hypothetical protein
VGVVLAATALAVAEWDRPPTWRERAESRFASRPSASVHASTSTITSPSEPMAPFATLALSHANFPAEGPVSVSLQLAEPSADAEPRPVTMLSIRDQRVYTTQGRLDGERKVATIEVPPDFLRPGTYLVQIETTERTAFPLRRYVVEVR